MDYSSVWPSLTLVEYLPVSRAYRMRGWSEGAMREAVEVLVRIGRSDLASDVNQILAKIDFDDLEVFRSPALDSIADGILDASSISELADLLERLGSRHGLRPLHASRHQRSGYDQLQHQGHHHLSRLLDFALRRSPLCHARPCFPQCASSPTTVSSGTAWTSPLPLFARSGATQWHTGSALRGTRSLWSPREETSSQFRLLRACRPKPSAPDRSVRERPVQPWHLLGRRPLPPRLGRPTLFIQAHRRSAYHPARHRHGRR